MRAEAKQFAYSQTEGAAGEAALLPFLPLVLSYQQQTVAVSGLVDTGSTVNVLPYEIGEQLGADWAASQPSVRLTGNLANYEARVLIVNAAVANFPVIRLVFAWTRAEAVPLLLGQVNFLMAFDVCFFRARTMFVVSPKQDAE